MFTILWFYDSRYFFTLEIFKKYSWNCWSSFVIFIVVSLQKLGTINYVYFKEVLPNPWIPTEEESWIVFSEFWGDLKIKTNFSIKLYFTWIEKGGNKLILNKREVCLQKRSVNRWTPARQSLKALIMLE